MSSSPRPPTSRDITAPGRRRRWPLVALIVVLLLGGAAAAFLYLNETDDGGAETALDPSPDVDATPTESEEDLPEIDPEDLTVTEILEATEDAETVAVETLLEARMPQDLDDGVPQRTIDASGSMLGDLSEARIGYEVSEVPNAAGYLGQIDGELSVAYSDDQMIITSPEVARSLSEHGGEWLSFELGFLSSEYMLNRGIGQLRELALSDPRVGVALLNGVRDLPEGEEADLDGEPVTEFQMRAGAPEAAMESPRELRPIINDLWDTFHLRFVPLTVSMDGNGRIRALEYRMVFPGRKGPGSVRLNVRHDFTEFGVDAPEMPPQNEVVTHEEYFLES